MAPLNGLEVEEAQILLGLVGEEARGIGGGGEVEVGRRIEEPPTKNGHEEIGPKGVALFGNRFKRASPLCGADGGRR